MKNFLRKLPGKAYSILRARARKLHKKITALWRHITGTEKYASEYMRQIEEQENRKSI